MGYSLGVLVRMHDHTQATRFTSPVDILTGINQPLSEKKSSILTGKVPSPTGVLLYYADSYNTDSSSLTSPTVKPPILVRRFSFWRLLIPCCLQILFSLLSTSCQAPPSQTPLSSKPSSPTASSTSSTHSSSGTEQLSAPPEGLPHFPFGDQFDLNLCSDFFNKTTPTSEQILLAKEIILNVLEENSSAIAAASLEDFFILRLSSKECTNWQASLMLTVALAEKEVMAQRELCRLAYAMAYKKFFSLSQVSSDEVERNQIEKMLGTILPCASNEKTQILHTFLRHQPHPFRQQVRWIALDRLAKNTPVVPPNKESAIELYMQLRSSTSHDDEVIRTARHLRMSLSYAHYTEMTKRMIDGTSQDDRNWFFARAMLSEAAGTELRLVHQDKESLLWAMDMGSEFGDFQFSGAAAEKIVLEESPTLDLFLHFGSESAVNSLG